VHVPQHHQHCHVGERLAALDAGEYVGAEPGLAHLLDDGNGTIAERHLMLLLGLHAFRRNAPQLGVEIEFIERGPDGLARARRRQDREFEGTRRNAVFISQPSHEGREDFVGQGGMILDLAQLRSLREDFAEVAAPECRVFAGSPPPNLGESEHALDAPAHPACRLRLRLPDRLNHLENKSCINVGDGHVADDGIGIGGQRVAPTVAGAWRSSSRPYWIR
jgi:hypothetical protein